MTLSKREQTIGIATLAAVAVAILYWGVTTWMATLADLHSQREGLSKKYEAEVRLIREGRTDDQLWGKMRSAGMAHDASTAESQLLNTVPALASDAGLHLASIRPDRASTSNGLNELSFQAAGDGTMAAVARFVHRLEIANVPIRVRDLSIAARTEATDDLTLQMRISTLWEEPKSAAPAAAPNPPTEGNQP